MDVAAVLALIEKGIVIVSNVVAAGRDAQPALKALLELVTGARQGSVTDEQLQEIETLLDRQLAEFNQPLPPAEPDPA